MKLGPGLSLGASLMLGTSGSGAAAPAQPTVTAPADTATIRDADTITYTATTSDTDLDEMSWHVTPSGGGTEVEVASYTGASPYTTDELLDTITSSLEPGSYTLIARAHRGGQTTDSDPIDVTIQGLPLTGLVAVWDPRFGRTMNGSDVEAWLDRTGTYTFQQTTVSKQPPYNSSVAAFNNEPTIGDIANTDQFMATTANVDLSGTQQVHAFDVFRTGDNAATKMQLEHTASAATGNGWHIVAQPGERIAIALIGDVGRNGTELTTSDSTAVNIAEADLDKGRTADGTDAEEEAQLYVNGAMFNAVVAFSDAPNNNTDNFSSDTLHVLNRADESLPSLGEEGFIVIYDATSADRTEAREYLSARFGVTLV